MNLAANLVDYRSMGVTRAELVRHASPQGAWAAGNYPVVLPDLGLLAFAYRSWPGKAILAIFACAGAYLTARSAKRYEGPFPKAIFLVPLAPLPVLPMMHQYGVLAGLGVIIAMDREDIRLAVERDLLPWGLYLLLTLAFWTMVAAQSGNLDRIRHFLIGYPPARYAMVEPFLRVTPLWMVFLLGTAVISILRNILFRKWEEDTFPM